MATSGTATFNLNLTEIAEEAFELCGLEIRSGQDFKTVRRSLNLLALAWANKGVRLWVLEEVSLAMVADTATYTLGADTIDVVEQVMRLNSGNASTQSDISITRISIPRYSGIPNKLTTGRPVQMMVDRQAAAPTVTMWPVPDSANYTLVYWRMKRIEDAGTQGTNTFDIPARFLPALVFGLAHQIALKKPEAADRIEFLKMNAEQLFIEAAQEDRDKTSTRLIPRAR